MYGFLGEIPNGCSESLLSNARFEDVAGVKPIRSAPKTDSAKRDELDEIPLTCGIDFSTDPRFRIKHFHAEHRKFF